LNHDKTIDNSSLIKSARDARRSAQAARESAREAIARAQETVDRARAYLRRMREANGTSATELSPE
jgi:hypothetical protein